jgi:hypothetical protein
VQGAGTLARVGVLPPRAGRTFLPLYRASMAGQALTKQVPPRRSSR